jgi:hypothetical protein
MKKMLKLIRLYTVDPEENGRIIKGTTVKPQINRVENLRGSVV